MEVRAGSNHNPGLLKVARSQKESVRLPLVLRRTDWALVLSGLVLSVLGIVLLATAGNLAGVYGLLARQVLFVVVGLGLALLFGKLHYSAFRSLAGPIYIFCLLLLLLTLVQEHRIRGIAAWLVVGGVQLQPSELMKVGMVLVLARIISGNHGDALSTRRFIAALGTVALPSALVLGQPDLGTVVLLVLTALGMLLVAGLSRPQKAFLVLTGIVVAVIAWKFLLVGYQRERFLVFLNPERDPLGSGYTVLQARTAFGSGGLFGRGLGWGTQSRLNFLPEAHTDFVFARLGEELGLIGVTLTLGLFGVLFSRLLRAPSRTSDGFGRALVVGSFLSLLVGLAVNAGMNVGLLPVTGVPLPFISYGGSSLVTSFLFLGMSLSVVVHGERWEPVPVESALIEAHA